MYVACSKQKWLIPARILYTNLTFFPCSFTFNSDNCEVLHQYWSFEEKDNCLDYRKIASSNRFCLEAHQIAYEGNFWSLCTVTFWQKVDFLIINAH